MVAVILPTASSFAFTPPPPLLTLFHHYYSTSRIVITDVVSTTNNNNNNNNNRHYRHNNNLLIKRRGSELLLNNSNRDDNDDDSFIEEEETPTTTSTAKEVEEKGGIRLNKVFKATHSRRAADKLIEEGRVTINGQRVHDKGGYKVVPFRDVVSLDGQVVEGWERINAILSRYDIDTDVHEHNKEEKQQHNKQQQYISNNNNNLQTSSFEYVKYYKPIGVTCTTDLRIQNNIIDSINTNGYQSTRHHRVYPVGRLDKETSGLILLTSDGRIVNAVLRGERKQPKVYKVKVDGLLEDCHLERLRVCVQQ